MSELRKRCAILADGLEPFIVVNYDKSGSGYAKQIDALEAFAKEQQIYGLEVAREYVGDEKIGFVHDDEPYDRITDKIDAAIKKLKEGG